MVANNQTAAEATLASRLARHFHWAPENVDWNLLRACVPFWKRPVWRWAYHQHPEAFHIDRWLVQEALKCTALREVTRCVEAAHYEGRRSPNFWRQSMGLRTSGRRLRAIAARLLRS